jgi:hypothetical protein
LRISRLDYIRLGLLILRGERRRLRDKYRKKGTRSPRENLNAEAEQLRRKLRPRYHYDDEVSRHNFALQNYNLAVQNYEKDVATFLRKTWELRISQTEQSQYRARDKDKLAAILSTMLSQEIERLQCGHKNRRRNLFTRESYYYRGLMRVRREIRLLVNHKRAFLIQTWLMGNGSRPDILLGRRRKPYKYTILV